MASPLSEAMLMAVTAREEMRGLDLWHLSAACSRLLQCNTKKRRKRVKIC